MKKFFSGLFSVQNKAHDGGVTGFDQFICLVWIIKHLQRNASLLLGKKKPEFLTNIIEISKNSILWIITFAVRHLEECVLLPHFHPEDSEIAEHWL